MKVSYNSQENMYKQPFGAVPCGTAIHFSVRLEHAEKVVLHGFKEDYEMKKEGSVFTVSVTAPNEATLVHYYFSAVTDYRTVFICPRLNVGGECEICNEPIRKYQQTVYSNAPTPNWFKGAFMYQIYVDRFFRPVNNTPPLKENILFHSSWNDKPIYIYDNLNRIVQWDFFGGNLQGVIDKLDYIENLGVDVIYFNPIFEASSNHKYDTADYSKVDSMYGDESILKDLIEKARKRGIYIILDGVFSHAGDDSIYFNKYGNYDNLGAFQGDESPYFSWFKFDSFPHKYKSWWGIDALPEIDKNNPSYRDFLFNEQNGIIKHWMELGIMGWRLDVADELPDDFIKQMKDTTRKFCDEPILLGEVWEDASNKVSYGVKRKYIIDDTLDSVSNYPLRDAIINYLLEKQSGKKLCKLIMSLQENYPADVFKSLMNLTGTHDSVRLATLLGNGPENDTLNLWEKRVYQLDETNYSISLKRIALFLIILFTLPGNPCIYYGDEMAMQGYKDPYNRGTFPWGNTESELHDLVAKLANLRKSHSAFKFGHFTYVKTDDNILCYSLALDEKKYTVYVNRSGGDSHTIAAEKNNILFELNTETAEDSLRILPYGSVILQNK